MHSIVQLKNLALGSQQVFQALLEKKRSWLPPDPWIDVEVLKFLVSISIIDEKVALQILDMPFIETVEIADYEAMKRLADLAASDPAYLQEVLSHPVLGDGASDDVGVTMSLLYLERKDPEAAAAIQTFPWIQDGVSRPEYDNVGYPQQSPTNSEQSVALGLLDMAERSRETFMAVVSKSWMQDQLTRSEINVLYDIMDIAHCDKEEAQRIVEMSFLDTIERDDHTPLENIISLCRAAPDGLKELLNHPEFVEGTGDGQVDEILAIVSKISLELREPEAAAAIDTLPWVQDGIDAFERAGIPVLSEVALESSRVFWALLSKDWVRDGLTPDESRVISELTAMADKSSVHRDEAAALRIVDMPFLETTDGLDLMALESLRLLIWTWEWDRGYLQQVLSHPSLQNGITDDWTNIVAVLHRVVRRRPELLDVVLDPEQTIVKERSITLPHTGQVGLSVIWPGGGGTEAQASQTMDLLEHAVRTQEEFMGVPYPKTYAIVLVADVTVGGGPRSIITVDPPSYQDYALIAHEAAHTYWAYAPRWFQEGGASFLDSISIKARTGASLPEPADSCSPIYSISELRRVALDELLQGRENIFDGCNYTLGEGMFLELYDSLGDEAFRQGFANLYLQLRDETLIDECTGIDFSACYIRAAFVTGVTPENAAIAEAIITRRYYGDQR